MAQNLSLPWRKLVCKRCEIDLNVLLTCGQSFTWKKTGESVWTNVLQGKMFTVSQDDEFLLWYCHPSDTYHQNVAQTMPNPVENLLAKNIKTRSQRIESSKYSDKKHACTDDCALSTSQLELSNSDINLSVIQRSNSDEDIVKEYFALNTNLESLYRSWSTADPHFAKIGKTFLGIRILQQDPTENLFSFICSSNNHISRISSMVNKLSQNFGEKVGSFSGIDFYSFPKVERLAQADVECKLRELSFGYRAKFIAKTAQILHNDRPPGWLDILKHVPYKECIAELMQLCGVGRKVADCVALMSLNKPHVVPVDTHVLQIAVRDYRVPGLSKEMKSLTPATHDLIGQYFYDLYGDYAGWAHTVLFAADLKQFSDRTDSTNSKRKSKKRKA